MNRNPLAVIGLATAIILPLPVLAQEVPGPVVGCRAGADGEVAERATVAACTTVIDNPANSIDARLAALAVRGDLLGGLEKFSAAAADFDKLVEARPDDPTAWWNRGRARMFAGQVSAAIEDFDKAITLRPSYAEAFLSRGSAWVRRGDYEAARGDFDQALLFRPDWVDALVLRAQVQERLYRYPEALADYDTAVAAPGEHGPALLYRGDAWLRLGDCDKARADYREAGQALSQYEAAQARLRAADEASAGGSCQQAAAPPRRAAAWLSGRWRKISDRSNAYCDDKLNIDISRYPEIVISTHDTLLPGLDMNSDVTGVIEELPDGSLRVYQMHNEKRREMIDIKYQNGEMRYVMLYFELLFGPAKCRFRKVER